MALPHGRIVWPAKRCLLGILLVSLHPLAHILPDREASRVLKVVDAVGLVAMPANEVVVDRFFDCLLVFLLVLFFFFFVLVVYMQKTNKASSVPTRRTLRGGARPAAPSSTALPLPLAEDSAIRRGCSG